MHEALFSIKVLLDQFKDGLQKVKVLHLIQSFPYQFAPLFISNGEISADEVVGALHFDSGRQNEVAVEFFRRYIFGLQQEGINFMLHV